MKTIKIFLASSSELMAERDAIALLVTELNKSFKSRGLQLEIERYEWENSAMGPGRKQDEYNNKLKVCEICLTLFWRKLGEFTKEEFDLAANRTKSHKNPERLYVYFKDVEDIAEMSADLQDFKKELYTKYQHFNDTFSNKDSLKLKFLLQLEIYQKDIIGEKTIDIFNGWVCVDGNPVINFDEISLVSKNAEYQKLRDELADANQNKDEKGHNSKEKESIEKNLNQLQRELFSAARNIARLKNEEISQRVKDARDAFYQGNIKEADEILTQTEKSANDILTDIRESKANARSSIEELLLKASIKMANASITIDVRVAQVYDLYSQAYNLAKEIVLRDELYDTLLLSFGDFLYDYGKPKESKKYRIELLNYRKATLGDNHVSTAWAYLLLGIILPMSEEKLDYYQKALDIWKSTQGEESICVAEALNWIGNFFFDKEEYEQAVNYYNHSLNIRKTLLGENSIEVAKSYNNLGNIYRKLKQNEKAKDYHYRALAIKQNLCDESKLTLATGFSSLGYDFKEEEQFNESLDYFRKALKLLSDNAGTFHPDTNNIRFETAKLYLDKGDYSNMTATMMPLAEDGNAMVQCGIGMNYEHEKNYSEALKWYRKAIEQNVDEALWRLGRMYLYGRGVNIDITKAKEFLTRSADLNNPDGLYYLALIYNDDDIEGTDHQKAFTLFKKAAELNNSPSQYWVGVMYCNGKGTTKDVAEGINWLKKAAEDEIDQAYYSLLQILVNSEQYREALPWAEKALKAYPNNATVNCLAAFAFQTTGSLQKSLECYQKALDAIGDEQKCILKRETIENEIDRIQRFKTKYHSSLLFRIKCMFKRKINFE